jgi:hypothetical protein
MFPSVATHDNITSNLNLISYREDMNGMWLYESEWGIESSWNILVIQLAPHSYATKFVGVPSAAWRTIPSSYLICEDDRAIPVFVQEAMVKACQEGGAQMQVQRIFCFHSPFLSQPDATVEFLRRAAGENA